jgi:hypothetical protein
MLREEGRKVAKKFLKEHLADIGRKSTYDIEKHLMEN